MHVSAQDFVREAGLEESLSPGQIKYKKVPGEKPGTSYTMVYDWKTDISKIRVEMRPGLTGLMPDKKDLPKYALWLQTMNYCELDLSKAKRTQH